MNTKTLIMAMMKSSSNLRLKLNQEKIEDKNMCGDIFIYFCLVINMLFFNYPEIQILPHQCLKLGRQIFWACVDQLAVETQMGG